MAAALGEDIPAIFGEKKDQTQEPSPVEEADGEAEEDGNNATSSGDEEPPPPLLLTEQPLGLADAMHMSAADAVQSMDDGAGSSVEASDAAGQGLAADNGGSGDGADSAQPARRGRDRLSGSALLLAEQAELQSRLGNSAETTMVSADTPAHGTKRKRDLAMRRRTTGLDELSHEAAAASEEEEEEASTADDLLARRERLRRQQERRRRRQTVAELKRRRSSWRGWVPSSTSSPLRPLASRSLPKRRRLTDYLTNILGIGASGQASDGELDGTAAVEGQREKADETHHEYPPRPTPIDLGWEHVDSESIPVDAELETNIGNSTILERADEAIRETQLDSGDHIEGDETPLVEPSQQPVTLYARSQSPDSDGQAAEVSDPFSAEAPEEARPEDAHEEHKGPEEPAEEARLEDAHEEL
ncbi:hypothetical protein LPJ61_005594, partial [Coemansia biformis]